MDAERWRRVEQLYHSAAELDSERREAFLAQACQGDKELQDEVQSLLSQVPSTTELLGGTIGKLAMDSLTDPCQRTLTPGLLLGPYRIEATLGAGGMGEVYRARDTRLGRTVAVKLLRAGSIDAMSRLRFQREARAASALNHPNICIVYDVGECEGQPFVRQRVPQIPTNCRHDYLARILSTFERIGFCDRQGSLPYQIPLF